MKAFWLGLGVGIGLGVLGAPKSGEETRKELWQRISEWRSSLGGQADVHPEEHSTQEERANDISPREASHDKTLADSFPTSDPPSSIPDPSGDESAVAS